MQRRDLLALAATSAASGLPVWAAPVAAAPRTLRVAFPSAEAGFDPPQVGDESSIRILSHIFESPLTYDHLARPALLVPRTAAALPEVSADFRHWVFTIRPGILFADDPVFKGRPRELTAADHVYSIKRLYDPRINTEHLYRFENAKLLGLSELRQRALKDKTAFPYDAEVPGLRVLDRYRFELRLAEPAPRFADVFTSALFAGAVAREVVEHYGSEIMAHPVGTGPFRLKEWRRSSRIVLERNPRFREEIFDAQPAADDAEGQALLRQLRGQRLPLVDRVEASIITEAQPRWLAFLGDDLDQLALPPEFAPQAVPAGRLAPYLAKRGISARRTLAADVSQTFFNFDRPEVGGYAPHQVALRRAIALAYDNAAEVRLVLRGQALPAQSLITPHTSAYNPALHSEQGAGDTARANALLDLSGYLDRDGDGWRERPDGRPLVIKRAHAPTQRQRAFNELWRKAMKAIGVRIEFESAPFAELIKRSLAGDLMMWGFIWGAGSPDSDFFLGLAYGPNGDQSNDARFKLPEFDRIFARLKQLGEGAERQQLEGEALRLMLAYVPYIAHHHSVLTDLSQPRLVGFRRHPFNSDPWRYLSLATHP